MSNLHDLPVDERPRERLVKYGVEALSLQELLALIFGRGTKDNPVMMISQKLLSKFGSLRLIEEASIEDLRIIKGLGLAKACQLKACFEVARRLNFLQQVVRHSRDGENPVSPEDIYQIVRSKIINFHKEHLLVISLDNRNKIIGVDTISVGTLNSNLIHPRETFEIAIKRHAAQIILCHNHPSGELTPSEDDLNITKNILEAGKIIGIELIDHLIIVRNNFFSFKIKKLI
ncbi:DNA repair protein RadC [Candidatus Roizmanbacteria bacterium]|nr:DNA repair protein RadC [Candidatus Roizmanbacteria bacterium]